MSYDVVVIGGGAAGLAAANAAVRAKASVLLISEGELGGDCTFTGCVPSKTLLESAAAGASFTEAMSRVRAVVSQTAATEDETVLRTAGIAVLRGRAHFVNRNTLEVDGHRVRCSRVVLATGAAPVVPPIAGLAGTDYLTTESVFELSQPPRSLTVLGGGAVGCELAQAFTRLGVEVSIVEAAERLLPTFPPEASEVLTEALVTEGVKVHTGAQATGVRNEGFRVVLRTAGGQLIPARRLLVAVGRRPVTNGLMLHLVGVRTDEHGAVLVDRHLTSTTRGIHAAGDITGQFPHTHAAYAMGRVAVGAALHRLRRPSFHAAGIPQVVFTEPEVATVGTTENHASRRARVAYLPMSEVDRANTAQATRGFVKLIAGPRGLLGNLGGGRVLGATIVSERAGELIHEPALAMRTGMFTGRLAQTVHAYPTWSIAVQQAAAQFFGGYGGRTAHRVTGRNRQDG